MSMAAGTGGALAAGNATRTLMLRPGMPWPLQAFSAVSGTCARACLLLWAAYYLLAACLLTICAALAAAGGTRYAGACAARGTAAYCLAAARAVAVGRGWWWRDGRRTAHWRPTPGLWCILFAPRIRRASAWRSVSRDVFCICANAAGICAISVRAHTGRRHQAGRRGGRGVGRWRIAGAPAPDGRIFPPGG